jgi:hypothetical protein
MTRFRFRPRFRGIAFAAMGVGGGLAGVAALAGGALLPIVTGAIGVAVGAAYLASPVWRIAITADDAGLEVGSPGRPRFRLAWQDVVKVVASPSTHTCFVDGGTPENSLLVPGPGAPAPYDIEHKQALYDVIVAHVPADKVTIVESLDRV